MVYTHLSHARRQNEEQTSRWTYVFLLPRRGSHKQTRARAYVRDDGAACVYLRNPVTVSHTGPIAADEAEERERRYRRNLKVKSPKIIGDGIRTLMSETRRRTERRWDARIREWASGDPLVALTQVHQDTGDPVTNSLTFCLIPTAVSLIHYKVHRATWAMQMIVIHFNQLGTENMHICGF